MVLILSFLACIKQPTYNSELSPGNTVVELPTIAILENEKGITPIPLELQETLSNRLQKRNITLQFYDHSEQFKESKEVEKRLSMYPESQIFLLEANAIYFAQISGRFRWETSFNIYLKNGNEIKQKQLQIPVFLLYHHQREAEALLEAEAILLREVELFLTDNLGGK